MKKGIIFGLAFAAGVGVGILVDRVIEHVAENRKEEIPEVPELLYFQNKHKEESEDTEDVNEESLEDYQEELERSGYTGPRVEIISEREYDIEDDGFEKPPFFEYFTETDELTNSDGELLEPQEYYIGDRFDKVHFQTNDWDVIYIRNHELGEKFKINKQREIKKEDFFIY